MTNPPLVFKYVGSKEYHLDILRKLQIRFTQPSDLNDPDDCFPEVGPPTDVRRYVDRVIERTKPSHPLATLSPLEIRRRAEFKIAEYKENPADLIENAKKNVRKWFNSIGVLSLAGSNENQTLWERYAENGAGFVVGFRPRFPPIAKTPEDAPDEGNIRRIQYLPNKTVIPVDEFENNSGDFPFQKREKWKCEGEWRVIRRLSRREISTNDSTGTEGIFLWRIDPRGIARIDIGERVANETVAAILEATKVGTPLEKVAVYRAFRNGRGTGFRFESLKCWSR